MPQQQQQVPHHLYALQRLNLMRQSLGLLLPKSLVILMLFLGKRHHHQTSVHVLMLLALLGLLLLLALLTLRVLLLLLGLLLLGLLLLGLLLLRAFLVISLLLAIKDYKRSLLT